MWYFLKKIDIVHAWFIAFALEGRVRLGGKGRFWCAAFKGYTVKHEKPIKHWNYFYWRIHVRYDTTPMYESYCQISFIFGVYFVWFSLDGVRIAGGRFWCAAYNSVNRICSTSTFSHVKGDPWFWKRRKATFCAGGTKRWSTSRHDAPCLVVRSAAQHPRSRLLSSVFQRFGRRWSFNNWYRDRAHPSPNFHREGQAVRNWCRLKHHSNLSRSRLKTQQYIGNLQQKCNASMTAPCSCQIWWSWVHAPPRKLS